uniref:VWFA domain-containing protein n=1 Tax=Pelusios castaneus TaxID=367368 RepID=A0A8C8S6R9_9SAUR
LTFFFFLYPPPPEPYPCGSIVDVERPIIFQEAAAGFGHSVVQFGSASTGGLLVGAPLQTGDMNKTGKVYKCDPGTGRCQEIPIQSRAMLCWGGRGGCPACGPTVHRDCGENMYLKGYCFLLDQNLQQLQRIPDTLPECPRRATDIVLLIDGSSSIIPENFRKMKTFISETMKRFRSTDTQFALMQFSNKFKQHFNFTEYRRSRDPDHLVRSVVQLWGATFTASAIQKAVQELFTSSRDEATKILIVITDGEKSGDPLSYSDVIPEAERSGIVRYAIGVGSAFSSPDDQQELHEITSHPTEEHIFQVDNFDALQGIQNQLQEKIFAIEGTQSQSGSSFHLEMSQEGFSSLLSPDGAVLGAVGAYDWSGGIFLYGSSGEPSFINVSRTSTDMNGAYLGYSSQVVTINGQSSYVVGAPRYQHRGKVILFSQDVNSGKWMIRSEVQGEQVGSYFGGTLCSVDLNRDGNTDLVLIGAPMYYTPLNGGQVYICPFSRQGATLRCRRRLQGQMGHGFGRFGASISEIGDISGDGQTDLAIGAPMENGNRGALYIFHGEKRGFSSQHRQRIEGAQFPSRLHYFGQAVSGGTDLTGDGLPDIAVGAQGQVLLLRSRPVLKVGVSVSFQPPTIPTSAFKCQGQEQLNTEASRANVCFTVTKSTKDSLGNRISSTIQYNLALDPGRTKIRAAFDSDSPVLSRELWLGIEKRCETHRITLPFCPEDTLTPITLSLNYTLTGDPIAAVGHLRPILSEDSSSVSTGLLPFEKDCGNDRVCEGRLILSPFSLNTLVVGVTPELNITVSIQNRGENSYSTMVRFFYPLALSYRRVRLIQVQPHPHALQMWGGRYRRGVVGAKTSGFSSCSALCEVCVFQVRNLRERHVPISVTFQFPVELNGVQVWNASEVIPSKVPASPCPCVSPANPLSHPAISFHPKDCSVATCKKIQCTIASLEMQQPLEFTIKGKVSFQWVSKTQQQKVTLVSEWILWGWMVPGLLGPCLMAFLPQVETVVESYEVYNYLPIIVGSSVGGLVLLALIISALYKLKFFKRQYKEMMDNTKDSIRAGLAQSDYDSVCPSPDILRQ